LPQAHEPGEEKGEWRNKWSAKFSREEKRKGRELTVGRLGERLREERIRGQQLLNCEKKTSS